MKTKQRTRREAFGIKRLSKDAATGNEEEGANPNEEERRDDVSIPPESAFKKAEGKILIRTFFASTGLIYLCSSLRGLFTSAKLPTSLFLSRPISKTRSLLVRRYAYFFQYACNIRWSLIITSLFLLRKKAAIKINQTLFIKKNIITFSAYICFIRMKLRRLVSSGSLEIKIKIWLYNAENWSLTQMKHTLR